jgi:hypothetical protein
MRGLVHKIEHDIYVAVTVVLDVLIHRHAA